MKVEIKIDASYNEPEALIFTSSVTQEVSEAVKILSNDTRGIISGVRDGRVEILKPDELIKIYACGGKVFALSDRGEYALRLRLYELEERLKPWRFIRISNSEIINLDKTESFDLSIMGTICVRLSDKTVSYVSRRYVSKIKKILGI